MPTLPLTGRALDETYKDLLQVGNANAGIDATLRAIADGEGTDSALSVSTTAAKVTGDLEVTGNLSAPDGDASAPAYAFANDPDTGLYRVGANSLGISVGGSLAAALDSGGRFLRGLPAGQTTATALTPHIQTGGTSSEAAHAMLSNWGANANSAGLTLAKSRGGVVGAQAIVQSGDVVGNINFDASDGVQMLRAVQITAVVNGTPGAGDMPGRLAILTTPDGTASPQERLRIDNAGNFGINGFDYGSGTKVIFIANATVAPTTNPTGGGVLYVEGGNLRYRGSSGTITTLGVA